MKKMHTKGQNVSIGQLAGLAVSFIVVAVIIGFGATVLSDNRETQCTGTLNTTSQKCFNNVSENFELEAEAWNASSKGLESMNKFSDNLPTLAIVIVAAVIIGVLATAFVLSR